ncbi:ABC transporter permease [Aneurinibacillus tyrosinisolvens]|uniref:ABC transporter permease n=1 Tax=Aneurinibacillus tyrosinisolvens TaxID=1443435 RepID=UPI00063FCD4F|nr:ABC transporter permease [Aneurinibacillus tyrosinisolvens]
MNSFFAVIRFTFLKRIRSRPFIVMTIIMMLVISTMIHLPNIIDKLSSHEPTKIGVVEERLGIARKLADYFKAQQKPDIAIIPLKDAGSNQADEQAAREQIHNKAMTGFIMFTSDNEREFPRAVYKNNGNRDFNTKLMLQTALQAVKTEFTVREAGLTPDQLNKLNAPVQLDSEQISINGQEQSKTESQMKMASILVYALLFLLYLSTISYGTMVATEITSEKSSRVMELLISSVSPLKQMFGKIIGICLLGFVQMFIFIGTAFVNLSLLQNQTMLDKMHLKLNDMPFGLLSYFLMFYILGYFIYATMFAAVGSLVSRTEEVQQAIMPMMFLIMGGFMIASYGLQQPNSTIVVAASFIPFFSPLIMFLRIGLGSPALWEIWLSIGILAASMFAIGWLASRIYRTGVLMYGKRPSFKELRKAMEAFKA